MANFTVNDILGVGFKYIQTAEDQLVPVGTGTSLAVFGTATWGPINKPYYFSGTGAGNVSARANFKNIFGYAGTKVDDGWDAAYYHFGYSNLGYFTRIQSSSNPASRSYKEVITNATLASLTGTSTLGETLRVYPSTSLRGIPNGTFSFSVQHKYTTQTAAETIPIEINFQTDGGSSNTSQGAILTGDFLASSTYTSGRTIKFQVWNESNTSLGEFAFTTNSSGTITSASNFVNLITSTGGSTVTINSGISANHFSVTSTGNTIKISTEPYYYGPNAKIKILQNDFNFAFIANQEDTGVDPFRSTLLSVINTKFRNTATGVNNGATFGTLYGSNLTIATTSTVDSSVYLVLTAPGSGSNSKITITGTSSLLGFQVSGLSSTGSDGQTIGSFRAKYRGSEGNLITVVFYNTSSTTDNTCEIYFRGTLISIIKGYTFNPTDTYNYFPNIIKDSSAISAVLVYDHNKVFTQFNEDDDALSEGTTIPNVSLTEKIGDGTYTLSGGTNGENNVNINLDLIPYIKSMSNEDIYFFDVIAAPGYPEQNVQKALLDDICDYRKDCFTVLDMPDFGNPSAAVDRAINWINGKYISRSERLNSIYGSVYFPWIKIRKLSYNSDMTTNSDLVDSSPVSRVLGMISRSDSIAGNTVRAPAGVQRGTLEGLEGLKQNLSAAEKDLLYADVYDNCINPIVYSANAGWYVNGQKTALRKNSNGNLTALSRINVMRTGLYIKKEISRIVPQFFHQPNDSSSREEFIAFIKGVMNYLVSQRAIEDNFTIVCDNSNNPAEVVNNNGLIAQIEFTPIKTIERIKVFTNIKEKKASTTITA
jgi:hypothetical protein